MNMSSWIVTDTCTATLCMIELWQPKNSNRSKNIIFADDSNLLINSRTPDIVRIYFWPTGTVSQCTDRGKTLGRTFPLSFILPNCSVKCTHFMNLVITGSGLSIRIWCTQQSDAIYMATCSCVVLNIHRQSHRKDWLTVWRNARSLRNASDSKLDNSSSQYRITKLMFQKTYEQILLIACICQILFLDSI